MIGAPDRLSYPQSSLVQRLGLRVSPLIVVDQSEAPEADGEIQISWVQDLFAHGESALVQRFSLVVSPSFVVVRPDLVQQIGRAGRLYFRFIDQASSNNGVGQ